MLTPQLLLAAVVQEEAKEDREQQRDQKAVAGTETDPQMPPLGPNKTITSSKEERSIVLLLMYSKQSLNRSVISCQEHTLRILDGLKSEQMASDEAKGGIAPANLTYRLLDGSDPNKITG